MYGLYRAANVAVKNRRKVRRPPSERLPLGVVTRLKGVKLSQFNHKIDGIG